MKIDSFYKQQTPQTLSIISASIYRCESDPKLASFDEKLPEVSREAKIACRSHISGHTILIRDSASLYYTRLTEALTAHKAVLFYVAPNFDVYGTYGNPELKEELKTVNLRFGCNLAEEVAGTNAAALAARLPNGVWTVGKQNFAKALHPYALYAFPVKGRYNRSVYVLLVARKSDVSSETVSFFRLIESTESITSSGILTDDVLIKDAIMRNNYSDEHTDNLFIVVNSAWKIAYVNNLFYSLFNTNYNEVLNYPVSDVVPELKFTEAVLRGEVSSPVSRRLRFSVSNTEYYVTCTMQTGSERSGMVITAQRILSEQNLKRRQESTAKYTFDNIVAVSEKFTQLKRFAERVSDTDCTVLIRGESGTGKELFAHSIHNASSRYSKPFLSINCAAIPRELIGSELFGYMGGAFTGASKTGAKGKFELADGGTLFLDEIAEMPLDMQSVLLRVIEEGSVTRIGGSKPIPVNVRLIAATNQNIEELIEEGRFRLDLFYRLNIISITVPPLREHREDIDILTDFFIERYSGQHGNLVSGTTAEVRTALNNYKWPGNIRELRNVIERGVIMADGRSIELKNISPEIAGLSAATPNVEEPLPSVRVEKYIIDYRKETAEKLMVKYDGNKSKVAKEMGIARSTLYRLLGEDDHK